MITQCLSIAVIALLGAMLPGPDFALVTQNSFFHSRKSGFFTTFGVAAAILVHMTYCVLGLALIISNSLLLFSLIKYLGAFYLIYLGINSLLSKQPKKIFPSSHKMKKSKLSPFSSFRQGFLCNLLNPKATLFFLSLFTVVIKANTPIYWQIIYAMEIIFISTTWFCALTLIMSHPYIKMLLEKAEKYIAKLLGLSLIAFGIGLAFM